MRKSADAATLMQQDFDITDVTMLYPSHINWTEFLHYTPDEPFSKPVIDFLCALSSSLLKDRESRLYPDVVTFAFFCRKANILRLKGLYTDGTLRLGRGIVFHIAPSNVPVNFGYSLVAGLLAGNYNVVRASSKPFPQVDLIVRHIALLDKIHGVEFNSILNRIALVRYGHNSQANLFFSSICQARVIWGGNETISRLRLCPIHSRSFDVTFADRYSFALFNADKMSEVTNIDKLAEGFYNDTYLFDQNACSAPHLIVWTGKEENRNRIKVLFWEALYRQVQTKHYHFQKVMAVDKLTTFYTQAVAMPICKEDTSDNQLVRVKVDHLPPDIDDYRGKCGYFTEYDATDIKEILPIIKYKYQTAAIYGYTDEQIKSFVQNNHLTGIDRFVSIGNTTAFSLTWDGYNLINTLSREITIYGE